MRGRGQGFNDAQQGAVLRSGGVSQKTKMIILAMGISPLNESWTSKARLTEYANMNWGMEPMLIKTAVQDRLDGWRYYRINEEKHEDVDKKLASLERRAKKLGIDPIQYGWGDETDSVIEKRGKEEIEHTYGFMRVKGSEPKLEGFTFLATLQHDPDADANIIRRMPNSSENLDLRPYYEAKPVCDHCNIKRHRKDTYLVRHPETGEVKQIGRSCLKDYLGGHNPDNILKNAMYEASLEDEIKEYSEFRGGGIPVYSSDDYMTFVAAQIRENGWLSRTNARWQDTAATADQAMSLLANSEHLGGNSYSVQFGKDPAFVYEVTDADRETAKEALMWARDIEKDNESDYMHNLRTVSQKDHTNYKNAGILASAIQAHDRAMEKETQRRERATKKNEYFGEPKEKLQDLEMTLKKVNVWDNDYGTAYQHIFEDNEGRTFIWKTTKNLWATGEKFKVSGTVKEHKEYNDTKQTWLLRCKLAEAVAA